MSGIVPHTPQGKLPESSRFWGWPSVTWPGWLLPTISACLGVAAPVPFLSAAPTDRNVWVLKEGPGLLFPDLYRLFPWTCFPWAFKLSHKLRNKLLFRQETSPMEVQNTLNFQAPLSGEGCSSFSSLSAKSNPAVPSLCSHTANAALLSLGALPALTSLLLDLASEIPQDAPEGLELVRCGQGAGCSQCCCGDVVRLKGFVFPTVTARLPSVAVSQQPAHRGDGLQSPDPGRAPAHRPLPHPAVLPPAAPVHRTGVSLAAEQPHGSVSHGAVSRARAAAGTCLDCWRTRGVLSADLPQKPVLLTRSFSAHPSRRALLLLCSALPGLAPGPAAAPAVFSDGQCVGKASPRAPGLAGGSAGLSGT